MLDRAATELRAGGSQSGADKTALARIDTAEKTADLSNDPSFKKLDPGTRQQTLDQIKAHETDTGAVNNIVSLAKSEGFQKADPGTQKALLGAMDHHAGDAVFAKGLEKLAGDGAFKTLTPAQQAVAVSALDQFATREVYKGKEGGLLGWGAKSVSDGDKQKILDNAAKVVTSPGFQSLPPDGRNAVLGVLEKHATDTAAADNIVALAKSQAFQNSSPATQKSLLTALDGHANDAIFREGLEKLAGDSNFRSLNAGQQADAVRAFDKFASREVYKGDDGVAFGWGSKNVSDSDKRQVLGNLTKVVTSKGFHDVAPDARTAMLDALDKHATDTGFTDRMVKLVNSDGFIALNDQKKEIDLLKSYSGDASFAQGVDQMLASPGYTGLNGSGKAKVLTDLTKLTATKSFKDASDVDKQHLVRIMGECSVLSVDPAQSQNSRTLVQNSINHVLDGSIPVHIERIPPSNNVVYFGHANKNGIYFNVDPQVEQYAISVGQVHNHVDTLVHETNHKRNKDDETNSRSADRFLGEYRARVLGNEARLGRPLTAGEQAIAVNNLLGNAYPDLQNLYNENGGNNPFHASVDQLRTTLNNGTTVNPEDLRQRFLDGWGGAVAPITSNYLNNGGNMDNQ
jgi:hypothetical protein